MNDLSYTVMCGLDYDRKVVLFFNAYHTMKLIEQNVAFEISQIINKTKGDLKMKYMPYTYLIGWSIHKKFYYGCEYANKTKIANPSNLWRTYFTSSKYVQECRRHFGEPDIVEIRKIFDTAEEAKRWEEKVLRRMKVLTNDMFLNENISGIEFGLSSKRFSGRKHSEESKLKNRNSQLGRKHSKEAKEKISRGNAGKHLSEETREKISKKHLGKKRDESFKKKRSELTIGEKNPRYDPTEYDFVHPIHGEIRCTKYYLKKNYNASNIHRVIAGHPKYSHSNGWKLK